MSIKIRDYVPPDITEQIKQQYIVLVDSMKEFLMPPKYQLAYGGTTALYGQQNFGPTKNIFGPNSRLEETMIDLKRELGEMADNFLFRHDPYFDSHYDWADDGYD